MKFIDVENKFRELLLPVFGLDSIDEVQPEDSLINDLGAESLDFVEILWVVEANFGVVLKTNEIVSGGSNGKDDGLFEEDRLTAQGASLLQQQFPHGADKIREGLSKADIFSLITIRDLAMLIQAKLTEVG